MRLFFVTEGRFTKVDGKYYTEGSFTDKMWERYLSVFDDVVIVARVKSTNQGDLENKLRSNGPHISFLELPYYLGPFQYFKQRKKIIQIMNESFHSGSAYIFRVPGTLGDLAADVLGKKGISYGVEVVGDPYDVFNGKGIKQKLLQKMGVRGLKKTVKGASAALYVTKSALQARYPVAKDVFNTNASNVILDDDLIVKNTTSSFHSPIRLFAAGSLSQMYKAPDIVISAVESLRQKGIDCTLRWAGDGIYKAKMMEYAKQHNVEDYVDFLGLLSAGKAVRDEMDNCDIFILVSRTEGLPRALIEAMARGKYCIATRVGGIPELLEDKWLIDPDNVEQLVKAILKVVKQNELIQEQTKENYTTAQEYKSSVLTMRRKDFYRHVKQMCENKI